jgi:hypothetical protein
MADPEQEGGGLTIAIPSDPGAEQASEATARPASSTSEQVAAVPSRAGTGSTADALTGIYSEPAASVRGVPAWTFAAPAAEASTVVPAAAALSGSGGAAGPAVASFPPPPPAPPALSATRTGRSPAVQLLTVPSLGPGGEERHPAAVVALSILTLGAYTVGWHARVNREMSDFDARLEVRPGLSAFALALPWVAGLLCTLAGAALVLAHLLRLAWRLPPFAAGPAVHGVTIPWAYLMLLGLVAVPYLVLLLPTSAVATAMTLERTRLVQERVGFRPDRQLHPVRRACRLLIPVFGGLWHVASVQSCLNRVWQAIPPLPPPPGPRRR